MRGHHGSAISHLMSGVRILEETVSSENTPSSFFYTSKDKLLVLFNRLSSQVQQVSRLILPIFLHGCLQYLLK